MIFVFLFVHGVLGNPIGGGVIGPHGATRSAADGCHGVKISTHIHCVLACTRGPCAVTVKHTIYLFDFCSSSTVVCVNTI